MQKSVKFMSTSQIWTKNFTKFPNSNYCQKKRFYGHLESIFDKPPKIFDQNTSKIQKQKRPEKFFWTPNMPLKERSQKFLPLSERFSLEVWKTKKSFFKDLVLLKIFLGAHRREILPHCLLFVVKLPKSLAPCPEKLEKEQFSLKKNYISYDDPLGPIECSFEKWSKFFFKKSKFVKVGHRTSGKKYGKKFFWVCNLQFRQRSQKIFANFREFFA